MSKDVVTGKQCQCTVCFRTFSTEANFDRHRKGDYVSGRYCVDPKSVGLVKKGRIWRQTPNPSLHRELN